MAAIASIDPTIDWLLKSSEPVIRHRALVDLLGASSNADVVDWGIGRPSEPITLGAMLVLKAAGRMSRTGGPRNQAHAWTVAAP